MREYTQSLRETLLRGLQPTEKTGMAPQGLLTCTNLMVEPQSLIGFEQLSTFIDSLPTNTSAGVDGIGWPYPQVFHGKYYTLLCYDDAIYSFNHASPPSNDTEWDAAKLTIYDYSDVGVEKALPDSTEPWRFVDFGPTFYLVRSDIIVFKLQTEGLFDSGPLGYGDDYFLAIDDVRFNCATRHRGRMIFGGVQSATLLLDAWNNLFNNYIPNVPEVYATVSDLMYNSINTNSVMWSSIGGGDTYFWFFPTLAINGLLPSYTNGGVDWPPFFDYLKRNEWGTMTMDTQGEVLEVKSLGKDVVVYTEDSVYLLPQVSTPMPTFGKEKLLDVGLARAGALGGTDKEHVFLSNDETLYRLTTNGLEKLDYKYLFSGQNFADNPIAVHYDAADKRYYINGAFGLHNYCLTQSGLSRIAATTPICAMITDELGATGVYADLTENSSYNSVIIETDWFNLGHMGYKTLTQLELQYNAAALSDKVITYDVYYMNEAGTTGSISLSTVSTMGIARVFVTGVAFRVKITITAADEASDEAWENLEISDFVVNFQQQDKRFRRSINVG